MSSVNATTPVARRRVDLTTIAGAIACACLAVAMSIGGGAGRSHVPVYAVGIAALAVLAGAGLAFAWRSARAGLAGRYLVALVLAAVAGGLSWIAFLAWGGRDWLIAMGFIVGLSFVAEWLAASLGGLGDGPTPWQQLASLPRSTTHAWRTVRFVVGAIAVLWSGALIAIGVMDAMAPSGGIFTVVLLVGALGTVVGLVVLPIVVLERARLRRADAITTRALDRQAVAAHLHDSVLQTLALIQRTTDHDQVVSLARQQEHSLRAWLAGRDAGEGTTLASALRSVCAEIERDAPGVVIPCVTAGDAVLDERIDAVVRATRESLRNAVRHAAGADVRVFLEVEGDDIAVYVRDTGPGFALDAVPEERRGVRDAILGRMAHAGGSAEIDSGDGGTEVVLRLPAHGRGTAARRGGSK